MKFGEDLFNNELRPAPSRSCYQPFSAEFHNGAFRERPLCATSRHSQDLQARCKKILMKLRNPKPPYNTSQLFWDLIIPKLNRVAADHTEAQWGSSEGLDNRGEVLAACLGCKC